MIGNFLTWFVIVAFTILFGWLTWRAWKIKRGFVKWLGVILSGLLTLLLGLTAIFSMIGLYAFYTPRGSPLEELQVEGTPEQIARGEHLALIACVGCHTTNRQLPLIGGRDIGEDSPLPLGNFYSINLTPGGPLKDWTDGEILRSLKDGVDREGRPLLVMSANTVRYFNDEDQKAIIAYLRSQPADANETPDPPDQPNLLAAIVVGTGLQKFQPSVIVPIVPKAETAEYGAYIIEWTECQNCHGEDLSGGTGGTPVLPSPIGPNLRVVQGWTLDQFITTLRTGVDPTGHVIDNNKMPWETIYRLLDDEEMGALFAYINALPPAK